jgi:hypothetical protein
MQLFFALVALCVCARTLECGVQGQLRECGDGVESCYDFDMRVGVDPKSAPRERYEPRLPRTYERWQLGAREQAREPALWHRRKLPRSPRSSWQAYNTR